MINVTHRRCARRTQTNGLEGLFSPCQGFLRKSDRFEQHEARSTIFFWHTVPVTIFRILSIVHREYGDGFRICVPGPKVKTGPVGFITPFGTFRGPSSSHP